MSSQNLIRGGALLGVILVGGVLIARSITVSAPGEKSYFYDVSEKELFPGPREAHPPLSGIGGVSGDGVRAMVVCCPADKGNTEQYSIAYLLTYTPELTKRIAENRAAEGTGQDLERGFVSSNTLVRSVDGGEWYPMSSLEGQKIMNAWLDETCPGGALKMFVDP